ncbi:unnamed protein product [Cylicocyclus nassatus]|uniref:Fibronectin type-III domain-containing protein n=1 Tax=Cylicocyclus nassatus TaxID=53992 RepID=A0AA36DK76_CYLNA|nr:unnamed protein product [Cylicocyclus nassatus]
MPVWLILTDLLTGCNTSEEIQVIALENQQAFLNCPGCEDAVSENWKFVTLDNEVRRFLWRKTREDRCKRFKDVKVSDSGTYTCSLEDEKGNVRDIKMFLMVLGPRDEPVLELSMNLSKAVRPGHVTMKWTVSNMRPRLNRMAILQSYRLEDGSTLDLAVHVNSTTDTNGTAVYAVDPSKDNGKNRYAKLEFHYPGGYETSIQRGPVHMTYEEMKVVNIEFTEQLDKVILKWSTTGRFENEKPTFSVSIFKLESKMIETQQKTEETTTDIQITKRPWNFLLEILPSAGDYTGIKGEKEIRLAERVPDVSPTGVIVQVYAYNQVYVKFDPIPNIQLYGEDKGCKVEVCEKQRLRECTSVSAPPRVGEVKFESLSASKIYQARVACSTSIGFGPSSDWTTIEFPATTAKTTTEAKKKTTKPLAKDDGPIVELNVNDGFKLVLVWKFKSADGKTYDLNLIKRFELLQFTKETSAQDYTRKVLSIDPKSDQFTIGLSPALLFYLGCYYFAVNATLKDNRNVYERTEEKCYGFTSLSYLVCFIIAGVIVVLSCIALWCCINSKKRVSCSDLHCINHRHKLLVFC